MSQGYENVLIWSHFKPICTKMFCAIFTKSFNAFWGHSNILKINCKAVSTTASMYLWPLEVSFMHFHLLKWHHFEKKFLKICFQCWVKKYVIFWKTSKSTWIWQFAAIKPLDLQQAKMYLRKDNIQIFHLASWDLNSAHHVG